MNNTVTVLSGPHSLTFPAGTSVSDIRVKLQVAADLDPSAKPYKGNEELSLTYITQPGDQITFTRRMGEKGN